MAGRRRKLPLIIDQAALQRKTYPFEDLKKGDAFLVEDADKWSSLRSIASRKGKALGRTFAVSRTEQGIEVRRTA